MPPRLTVVGELERGAHYYLPEDARCYFWGDYTPHEHTNGQKWRYSPTNQLIANFKKKMDRRGQPDWKYKAEAIATIAGKFSNFWHWDDLAERRHVALIPIPPSRARTDAMYDPRMLKVLNAMASNTGVDLDIRDCLSMDGRYAASHESGNERPKPDELFEAMSLDRKVGRCKRPPGRIYLFDDLLTTGAHYVAASRHLNEAFPDVPIVGVFVARRVVPNPFDDFDVVDDL